MLAQKCKKNWLQNFCAFLNAYEHKTQLIKMDSSRAYSGLLENQKPGNSRELFLPESGFKTCYTVIFSYKHSDFGKHEIQTLIFFHMSFYMRTQNNMKTVLGT